MNLSLLRYQVTYQDSHIKLTDDDEFSNEGDI